MTTAVQEGISLERSDKFEGWAVVELMGHKKLAGFVTEQVVAGAALLRVDVPETQQRKYLSEMIGYTIDVKPGYTKLFGAGSIYCITPTNEATARACAQEIERYNDPLPVTLPRLLSAPASTATAAVDEVDHEILEDTKEGTVFDTDDDFDDDEDLG